VTGLEFFTVDDVSVSICGFDENDKVQVIILEKDEKLLGIRSNIKQDVFDLSHGNMVFVIGKSQ